MNRKEELAHRWIKFAEEDLESAKTLIQLKPDFTHIIVFHAQQASEKIIKAFLIHLEIPFKKIHDLNKLLGMIEGKEGFSASLYETIAVFEKFNVEVRYPDGEIIPTKEDAEHAIISSEKIVNHFKEKIKQR